MEPYKWYPQRAGRVDLVLERAKATGAISDPVVRQEIAKLLTLSKTAEWTARRARAAQAEGRALMINATPTLFLNGRKLEGAVQWQVLEQLIKLELDEQTKTADAGEKCCEVTLPKLVK